MDLISFILFWSFEFVGGIALWPLAMADSGKTKVLTSSQGSCYLILSN